MERAAPLTGAAIDAAIKRELLRFTEGEQKAFLRDFLATDRPQPEAIT